MPPIGAGNYAGVSLSREQVGNAQTIARVGYGMGIPGRGVMIALMTSMQEAKLRNLKYGDRDSQGLFQQRPSQGWGTVAQVTDPQYAARKFYEALLRVPGWESMASTRAAQAVQRSAFPTAYAKWEPMARSLVKAMGGDPGGVAGMSAEVNPLADSLEFITNRSNWYRIGLFILGGALFVFGVFALLGVNLASAIGGIGKAARKVKSSGGEDGGD